MRNGECGGDSHSLSAFRIHHSALTASDPSPLRRAAAVVRDRRHVADRGDLEADRLERAKGALAARARTLDLDFERADAVLGGRVLRDGGIAGFSEPGSAPVLDRPSMPAGSWLANAPTPATIPERLRNVRRSAPSSHSTVGPEASYFFRRLSERFSLFDQ